MHDHHGRWLRKLAWHCLSSLWLCAHQLACGGSEQDSSVSLQRDVAPILHTSCTFGSSCHGAVTAAGYMRLGPADAVSIDELYAALVSQPSVTLPTMPRIAPGDPSNSFLIRKLHGDFADLECAPADCGERMPFGAPALPADAIDLIERWVMEGARP